MKLFLLMSLMFSGQVFALTPSQPAIDAFWEPVVLIKTQARDVDGSDVPAYCNATFVTERVLVTAAHCVHHAQVINSFSAEITTGYYKYGTHPDGTTFRIGYVTRVKKTVAAKFYFTNTMKQKIATSGLKAKISPSEDMAVIFLSEPFGLGEVFPLAQIVPQSEFEGLKNNLNSYAPTVVTINFIADMSTDTKRFAQLNSMKWNNALHFESRSTVRVQEGDSGAPLFARTGQDWKLVAVVKGRATTAFSNWDVFTGVGQNICQLAAQLPLEFQKSLCR